MTIWYETMEPWPNIVTNIAMMSAMVQILSIVISVSSPAHFVMEKSLQDNTLLLAHNGCFTLCGTSYL